MWFERISTLCLVDMYDVRMSVAGPYGRHRVPQFHEGLTRSVVQAQPNSSAEFGFRSNYSTSAANGFSAHRHSD